MQINISEQRFMCSVMQFIAESNMYSAINIWSVKNVCPFQIIFLGEVYPYYSYKYESKRVTRQEQGHHSHSPTSEHVLLFGVFHVEPDLQLNIYCLEFLNPFNKILNS